ncbi:hypothetical protein GCM10008904_18880 [Paraclostridium ghonii]|uniref:Copper amine oxidase-like N-terminal domain-containing protein n=1 Tax=Paraclostridium ghonii TaxID=29358 RepID=A0ABU0MW82_9FIRM|nr:stalk domain-containing protein [Paeniclostridium ghonii]MDQ0555142.1 hypothetical protein [Paeniclostridium ghonii]
MKNKKVLALATVITLCTTTLAFANEIKVIQKNGEEYVPFKKLVKELGGKVEESKEELKINVSSKQITIQNQSSFAKVDENYYPLEEKEMNGYKIPIDKKPIYEDKELYVSPQFLRSAKLVNFEIENGKLIIDNKVETTTSTVKEKPKKEENSSSLEIKKEEPKREESQEKAKNPVNSSKPNNTNNNNSNNNNNNHDRNNNQNNGSSEDKTSNESNNGNNVNDESNNVNSSQNNNSESNTTQE